MTEMQRAEALIASKGGDYGRSLEELAELAMAHATVLDYLFDHEAAHRNRVLVEAICAVIDERRRASGLSTSDDEFLT